MSLCHLDLLTSHDRVMRCDLQRLPAFGEPAIT